MKMDMYKNLPDPISNTDTTALIREGERERAVLCNIRLVFYVARKFENLSCDMEDLVQCGCIGLIKAVNGFDCDKGYQFATFAVRCIENEILMFLRRDRKHRGVAYLSDVIREEEGDPITLGDTVKSDVSDVCEEAADLAVLKDIWDTVETLDSQERTIMILRYGKKGESQRVVAEKTGGVSQSYVSRVERKAIRKIRGRLHV